MTRCILIPLVVGLGMAGVAPEVQLDVPFLRQKKNGCGLLVWRWCFTIGNGSTLA